MGLPLDLVEQIQGIGTMLNGPLLSFHIYPPIRHQGCGYIMMLPIIYQYNGDFCEEQSFVMLIKVDWLDVKCTPVPKGILWFCSDVAEVIHNHGNLK